eukprot:Hpha_TRINITY_DN30589_c0_g1::TRINITY_DN30589_c0_g1_i1::g.193633::m.193633
MQGGVLHAAAVSLFRYDGQSGQYETRGPASAVLIGDGPDARTLVCYRAGGEGNTDAELCHAAITKSNQATRFCMQSDVYASFRDGSGEQWSIYFKEEESARMFAMHYALAVWAAAGQPPRAITTVDLSRGGGEVLQSCDAAGVKFNSFVVSDQCGLGSQYDTNLHSKRTYKFAVPSSNLRLEGGMRGFEGAVMGMKEGGRRALVVPQTC